jgi:3'(2'), 5'-bisphosphate nucleotidase
MGVVFSDIHKLAIRAALKAGEEIMEVYETLFDVEYKSDKSPITLADKRAHQAINTLLASTHIPILSEEGIDVPFEERKLWQHYWLIDPLDGTREFVKRNGEFCVNIALMENNIPVFGVVYAPVMKLLYAGGLESGVFKAEAVDTNNEVFDWKAIHPNSNRKSFVVVGSRSHAPLSDELIAQLEKKYREVESIHLGSSLKICLIVEGTADLYYREGPTMEWDTAAGDAFCRAFGMPIQQIETNQDIEYNKPNLVNPDFYAGRLE